jgi:hypothetical protein
MIPAKLVWIVGVVWREHREPQPLDAHGATAAFGISVGEEYVSSDAGGTGHLAAADLPPAQCALPVAEG